MSGSPENLFDGLNSLSRCLDCLRNCLGYMSNCPHSLSSALWFVKQPLVYKFRLIWMPMSRVEWNRRRWLHAECVKSHKDSCLPLARNQKVITNTSGFKPFLSISHNYGFRTGGSMEEGFLEGMGPPSASEYELLHGPVLTFTGHYGHPLRLPILPHLRKTQ